MFSKETYIERRRELACKLQAGLQLGLPTRGLILLPGHTESPINYAANAYRFRQDSTFLYYFGLALPDLAGVIDIDTGEAILFGDDFTIDDIIWMGPQPSVAELGTRIGVARTAPFAALADTIAEAVRKGRGIHILPPYRAETRLLLYKLLPTGTAVTPPCPAPSGGATLSNGTTPSGGNPGLTSSSVALAPSEALIRAVVDMRDKKSPEEIVEIEKACRTGYMMHTLAMQMCRPGASEREIAGAIEGVALQQGWGVSFHSIVSQRGEVLHNHSHDGILQSGRMLLVDAGAEASSGYASDFTRTIPVDGRFTPKQKDIYDIVLAANNHAFSVSGPGVRYVDVHIAASRVLVAGLHSLGLVRGNVDEAVAAGVHSLFMPHGLGHLMGLDVHDMENLGERFVGYDAETPRSTDPACSKCRMGRRLQPGMVVTVEPGIYFVPDLIAGWRREGICAEFIDFGRVESYLDFGGIRLEDDMLITPDGNILLGEPEPAVTPDGIGKSACVGRPRRIPITTDEVENAIRA